MTVPTSQERTFAFVDLAGFTAATEVHGDVTAVELAQRLGLPRDPVTGWVWG